MSIGTASINVVIDRNKRSVSISGDQVWFGKLVTVVLTGFVPSNPANIAMLVYRGDNLVATSQNFAGPDSGAAGTLDANTTELQEVLEAASDGSIREFSVYFYDTSSAELLASGKMDILAIRDYGATSPVTPISDETVFIGSFAFYNGLTYVRSIDDGLYYEFKLSGSGNTTTPFTGTTGITIPGAP